MCLRRLYFFFLYQENWNSEQFVFGLSLVVLFLSRGGTLVSWPGLLGGWRRFDREGRQKRHLPHSLSLIRCAFCPAIVPVEKEATMLPMVRLNSWLPKWASDKMAEPWRCPLPVLLAIQQQRRIFPFSVDLGWCHRLISQTISARQLLGSPLENFESMRMLGAHR